MDATGSLCLHHGRTHMMVKGPTSLIAQCRTPRARTSISYINMLHHRDRCVLLSTYPSTHLYDGAVCRGRMQLVQAVTVHVLRNMP